MMLRTACLALAATAASAQFVDRMTAIGAIHSDGRKRDPYAEVVAATADNPVRVKVSEIGAAGAKAAFDEQIADIYGVNDAGKVVQQQRYQRSRDGSAWELVDAWQPTAPRVETPTVKILQHIEGTRYLVEYSATAATYAADMQSEKYVDGAVVQTWLAPDGGIHEYVTVMGAKRRVGTAKRVQEPQEPDTRPYGKRMSWEQFQQAMRAGFEPPFVADRPLPCARCKMIGFAEVENQPGKMPRKIRVVCPECKGAKTVVKQVLCRMVLK